MAAIPLEKEIYYPESDDEPMAETKHHLQEMVYVWEGLEDRFEAEPDVFVGANMFLYYRKGDPTAVVAPDGFVVKGVPKRWPGGHERTTYLLWEEKQAPCFVLETTSTSTHRRDEEKKKLYEHLGVAEYFQFDPYGEYLKPRLQGVRLANGKYRKIRSEPDGSLLSQTTGVIFRADGERLRLTDVATGAAVLRSEEKTKALRKAEANAAAEAMARQQAEQKASAEAKARRQAEEARRQAEEARRQAEEARRQAEQKAASEAAARHQAEERIRALEEELARRSTTPPG
jgi:Uma2 family endonuclease